MKPAVTVQGFSRPVWVLQVASEHTGATNADLTQKKGVRSVSRQLMVYMFISDYILRLAHLSLSVLSVVLHVRDINHLHHGTGQRSADMT